MVPPHGGRCPSNREILDLFERALAESRDDPRLARPCSAELAANVAAVRVERIEMTEAWAEEALALARGVGEDVERQVLYALAWTRSLGGHPVDDLCERFRELTEDSAFYMAPSPERVAAQRLVWRGSIAGGAQALNRLLDMADERGEPSSYALQRLHLCELELRAGGWDVAEHLLDEWAESSNASCSSGRCTSGAARSSPPGGASAKRHVSWADEAIARAGRAGRLGRVGGDSARWELQVCWPGPAPRPERCARPGVTRTRGVEDPGVFPAAPELVEMLVELGGLDEAAEAVARLAELAEPQDHPGAA